MLRLLLLHSLYRFFRQFPLVSCVQRELPMMQRPHLMCQRPNGNQLMIGKVWDTISASRTFRAAKDIEGIGNLSTDTCNYSGGWIDICNNILNQLHFFVSLKKIAFINENDIGTFHLLQEQLCDLS